MKKSSSKPSAVDCVLSVRGPLMEVDAWNAFDFGLRAKGFSAAEFRAATREALAHGLTVAEDYLEGIPRQGPRVAEVRRMVREVRRMCE